MLSRVSTGSPNILSPGEAVLSSMSSWTTAGMFNWEVPYFLSLSRMWSALSLRPGCVNWLSFICFCWKRPIRWFTILDVVPITQPCSSSSLSLPISGSFLLLSSSSSYSPSSDLATSLRLPPMVFNVTSNVDPGFVVVNSTFQCVSYLPASAQLLSLHLELAFKPQRSFYPHNLQFMSPSLYWLKCACLVVSSL